MDSNQVQTPMTETRPSTAGLIELHAYLVPEDLWNPKLNKVPIDVIWRFISLGFIRVPPDMKLQSLRESLAEFLGEDAVTDKFVFLKCVGSSLAVVKARQEHELKLKAFAPPYAREPELYLLPGGGNEGSTYGSTVTPDQHQYHTDYSGSDRSEARVIDPTWDKPINPPINENKTITAQPAQEKSGGRSFIWNRKQQGRAPIAKQYNVQIEDNNMSPLMNGNISNALKPSEVTNSGDTKKLTGRNPTGDSGISDSLLGAETERSHHKRAGAKEVCVFCSAPLHLAQVWPTSGTPDLMELQAPACLASRKPDVAVLINVTSLLPVKITQYIITICISDLFRHSPQNPLIMKITTKQQELDQLKRNVENARIKLLIEIKMRKQASSDLQVLKAELAQKKATSGLANPPVYAT
ncbi:spermatogenesis-associated protein 1 [Mixophyes fleayi]|uniref:spermatogenesis-associated protein 1 n=1 Tax=Mixophyes fleayi TaxID=3061075 RepID=UPI003F4D7377